MYEMKDFERMKKLSPQFGEAFLQIAEEYKIKNQIIEEMKINQKVSEQKRQGIFPEKFDFRDFNELIQFEPGMTTEEKKEFAKKYLEDFFSGPEKRKEMEEAFLRKEQEVDFRSFDLSCLTSNDTSRKKENGMTQSEEDFLKLFRVVRCQQAWGLSKEHMSEVYDKVYPNPEAQMKHESFGSALLGMSDYVIQILRATTGYDAQFRNLGELQPTKENFWQWETGKNTFQTALWLLSDLQEKESEITVPMLFGIEAEEEYQNLKEFQKSHTKGRELSEELVDIVEGRFSDATLPVHVFEQAQVQTKLGLDIMDMIMIDGISVKDYCADKVKNMEDDMQKDRYRKGEVLSALLSGKHRVDMVSLSVNEKGEYHTDIIAMKPDMTKKKEAERQYGYGRFRKFLDRIGIWKIKTDAERVEEYYQQDPGKEERQEGIKKNFQSKLDAFYKKENEHAVSEEKGQKKNLKEELGLSSVQEPGKKAKSVQQPTVKKNDFSI